MKIHHKINSIGDKINYMNIIIKNPLRKHISSNLFEAIIDKNSDKVILGFGVMYEFEELGLRAEINNKC
jgi:hypothetical protein